jgi:orotate phosphoribosyltransferase
MTRTELAKRIVAASFLTGRFKLRSGKTSSFYLDKYRFESAPAMLAAIVDEMTALLPKEFDRLAGMELGGVPLATAISLRTGKPCLFVRKKAKEYGTCNLVEGCFARGERAVVIEDVITTAGQVGTSIEEMRALGIQVSQVICAIDREEGGRENLAKLGCALMPVFTWRELSAGQDTGGQK